MGFIYDYKCTAENCPPAYWFIFNQDGLLAREDQGSLSIPFFQDIKDTVLQIEGVEYIGSMDGKDCYTANVKDFSAMPGYSFNKLVPSYGRMDDKWFWIAFRAYHLLGWSGRTHFCSVCGGRMEAAADERARQCVACGVKVYPRISPAIIVAITRGDKLLLAHASKFVNTFYSVIAGFVEPGETLEECVRREVMEEVGIEVKNIKYFSSQPWPFPDSLMIAFTAEYSSGELKIDNKEITDAGWFGVNEMPNMPSRASVAMRLIDWFVEQHKA